MEDTIGTVRKIELDHDLLHSLQNILVIIVICFFIISLVFFILPCNILQYIEKFLSYIIASGKL